MESKRGALIELVAEVTHSDPSEIQDGSRLAQDLQLKSANRIELTALIGDRLGIEVSFFEALKAKTFGDLVALVDAQPSTTVTG